MIIIRDPKRIEECLYYIEKIWQSQPDTRFNQLIDNLQREFNKDHHNFYYHKVWEQENDLMMSVRSYVDLFHVEDDEFIDWLKNKLNLKKEKR